MPSAANQMQRKLIALREQIAAALKAQDWESLRGLDLRARECLQELASHEPLNAELQSSKNALQQLYARAIPVYADACEKMRQILLTHVDYAEACSAYLRTDLLQGDK